MENCVIIRTKGTKEGDTIMMVELGRMKRQTIEELCKENNEVLVRGAVDGTIGRVWVPPQLGNSSYCLIVVGDFAYLMGLPPKRRRALDRKTKIYQSAAEGVYLPAKRTLGGLAGRRIYGSDPSGPAVMPCTKTSITLIPGY